MEIVNTNIQGLTIRINKVMSDERGFLGEMAPSFASDSFFKAGVNNIYVSVAKKKLVARAEHYHNKNIENFFTISGTALWLFIDFRKDSPTFNNFYTVILGAKKALSDNGIPSYTVDDLKMAQVLVPTGVYHVYWSLTDEDVAVLAIASEPYDKNDYERPDIRTLENFSQVKLHLEKFGIVL